jgi:3-oxoacyl-[acyl-carrier-protein] synthase-1
MSQLSVKDFVAVVTAVGMVTPVGHTADQSCASIRAGLSRITESPEFRVPDEKGRLVPANCAAVSGVTDGQRRFLRHYRMAVRAFTEAIGRANLDAPDLVDAGIYLCICEPERIKIDSRIQDQLILRICKAIDVPDLTSRTQVFPLGHAGVFHALQAAIADLAAERIRYAIVGAADTYLDEATLGWLADINRLKTDRTVIGIIPGEGAAFVVLENRKAAVARAASPLARLDGVATAMETHGIYADAPCRGEGLTSSLQSTLAALPDGGVDTAVVVCDLNGERYRASEWGLTLSRALGTVRRSPAVWHPAGSIGDAGAAAGAINLVLAAVAVAKGYARPGQVLVWGSSDEGLRGSVYLRSAEAA